MRPKINPWSRSLTKPKEEEKPSIFSPKRMNLPQFKRNTEEDLSTEMEEEEEEGDDSEMEEEIEAEKVLKSLRRNTKGHHKGSKKRRSYNLSVCVSEEEEAILRACAAESEMGFSEWARKAMFKFGKVKAPKR